LWQNKFFMKKKNTTDKNLANIEDGLSKTEQFVEKNNKPIILITSGVVLLIIVIFSIKGYQSNNNHDALNDSFEIKKEFDNKSLQNIVHLDSVLTEKHTNTIAANLATYYAGISYYDIKDYRKAIEKLKRFDSNDPLLNSIALMKIGDSFSELNQTQEAITYYKKALKKSSNNLTSPIILEKCAKIHEAQGDKLNAIACYKSIKEDYPESRIAENIDKHINKFINEVK